MSRAVLPVLSILLAYGQQESRWESIGPRKLESTSPHKAIGRVVVKNDHVWVSRGDRVFMSEDAGQNWKISNPLTGRGEINGVEFTDAINGWAAGAMFGRGTIFKTTDGGVSWKAVLEAPKSTISVFTDVKFWGTEFGVAVGGGDFEEGQRSLIAITHDGGAHWTIRTVETQDPAILRRISFQSPSILWSVGGSSVYVSRDSGETWRLAHTERGAVDLDGLSITEDGGIYVTGGWGLLVKSPDRGSSWERVVLPASFSEVYLCSLVFADSRRGWLGGDRGRVASTTDGGRTWLPETTGQTELLRDMVVDGSNVYAIADEITVLKRNLRVGPRE
jgi:photosystem II stability/assembly factor-like uncharacterized protein